MSDPYAGAFWSGWGADIENTRYQRTEAAGITKADVPKLKLKWAFGFPLGISAYSPPAIASGRVFVGTDIGWVYSLDAKTGCYYWGYETGVTVRPAHQHRSGDRTRKHQIRGLLRRRQGQRLRARRAGRQAAVEAQGGGILSGAHHGGSRSFITDACTCPCRRRRNGKAAIRTMNAALRAAAWSRSTSTPASRSGKPT